MKRNSWIALALTATMAWSCSDDFTPKPKGFHRIDIAEPIFHLEDSLNAPFQIEISDLSKISYQMVDVQNNPGWFNIFYPSLNATIFASYHEVDHDSLNVIMEDLRRWRTNTFQKQKTL
jgi:hypothetical protein